MPDLSKLTIPVVDSPANRNLQLVRLPPKPSLSLTDPYYRAADDSIDEPEKLPAEEENLIDPEVVKFVLDSVIDFLEGLTLSGEPLKHAGQLLRDVEDLRGQL